MQVREKSYSFENVCYTTWQFAENLLYVTTSPEYAQKQGSRNRVEKCLENKRRKVEKKGFILR